MSGNRIVRTKTIDGVVTPAFIHNGPSYFFINLPVYADGLVNCWDLVDLPLFKKKLRQGWVTTAVPDGEEILVHGLGSWIVVDGDWPCSATKFVNRVTELVRELNPRMENLHDCHGRPVDAVGTEHPMRLAQPGPFPKRIEGDNVSVFVRVGDVLYLADLRAYADGVIELGRLPSPETLDIEQLKSAIEQGRLCSSLAAGSRVEIHQLGSFTVREERWSTEIQDILRGVPDLIDAANGRPTSVHRCRRALKAYRADPTETTREALRIAYEAVPRHKRMYVGDMDTKDTAVRMILYGDQEIEGWSHRIVARAQGKRLPTITVPKPKKR